MNKANIQGRIMSQKTHPCGRLVKADYDCSSRVMSFDVPSLSRQDRVYAVELDCTTGQVSCPCEAFRDFRNAYNMPYRDSEGGAFLEHVYKIHPLITRQPRFLCPHARKIRLWLKGNKAPDGKRLYDHLNAIVEAWEKSYLESKWEQHRETA